MIISSKLIDKHPDILVILCPLWLWFCMAKLGPMGFFFTIFKSTNTGFMEMNIKILKYTKNTLKLCSVWCSLWLIYFYWDNLETIWWLCQTCDLDLSSRCQNWYDSGHMCMNFRSLIQKKIQVTSQEMRGIDRQIIENLPPTGNVKPTLSF